MIILLKRLNRRGARKGLYPQLPDVAGAALLNLKLNLIIEPPFGGALSLTGWNVDARSRNTKNVHRLHNKSNHTISKLFCSALKLKQTYFAETG